MYPIVREHKSNANDARRQTSTWELNQGKPLLPLDGAYIKKYSVFIGFVRESGSLSYVAITYRQYCTISKATKSEDELEAVQKVQRSRTPGNETKKQSRQMAGR